MYKVGVMVMGKMKQSPKRVKEIILEVEGKTKITNILDYLLEMGKIENTNFEFSLEKGGRPISDISNISQALKYTTPVNGVIKLYLYEKDQFLNNAIQSLKKSQELQEAKKARQNSMTNIRVSPKKSEQVQAKRCCCF